jgi:hypothetical protein
MQQVNYPQEGKFRLMATNASTWFYNEPEHRAYLLEERINHTFWSNRINGIYFDCVSENPPFKMVADWNVLTLTIEWIPNEYFTLTTKPSDAAEKMIVGIKEILGFKPTIWYVDLEGDLVAEWHLKGAAERLQEIQGNPKYSNVHY